MKNFSTEITSDQITSDNPIHQRLLQAYYLAMPYMKGDLLEVGCGEGRGVSLLAPLTKSYLGIDKIQSVVDHLSEKHPGLKFVQMHIPPFNGLADDAYDVVIAFQVIEHIKNDSAFLQEIHRVLKPGGLAILTTPNKTMSLSRNPWHVREYTPKTMKGKLSEVFEDFEVKGIGGNEKVMTYHQQNKESVAKITRFGIFNLQYRLPAPILRIPYELLNRMNRNRLEHEDGSLVASITHEDYPLSDQLEDCLDFFCLARKS